MARKPAAPGPRQSIGIRPRTELKQALEKIAAENGRSLAQEVERRLEQSLEERPHQKLGDPLPGVFSDELRRYLRGQRDIARFLEALADVSREVVRVSIERDRDEIEIRTALRAANDVVACWFFWRGEKEPPYPEGPQPALGARLVDYPPAHLGHEIAKSRLLWLGNFHDEGALFDTLEGRITNAYGGNGRETLAGPTREEAEVRRAQVRESVRAAVERGDIEFEAPENLHKYKPVPAVEPSEEDQAPARSLKDILGR